jgi:hypothetical protein
MAMKALSWRSAFAATEILAKRFIVFLTRTTDYGKRLEKRLQP